MPNRPPRTAGPPPDASSLHDAALAYLARYAATEAMLRRVLERRIQRWAHLAAVAADPDLLARQIDAMRATAHHVVARLVTAGAVNDATFAENRARNLVRAGRSRRAAAAHLAAKGVDSATAQAALPADEASELASALVLARRRRIGPFRQGATPDAAGRHRELAMLARAGFPQDVARRALAMETEEAETLVIKLRR